MSKKSAGCQAVDGSEDQGVDPRLSRGFQLVENQQATKLLLAADFISTLFKGILIIIW